MSSIVYATAMSQISWGKHALIFFALFVNLWVGGDFVELWLGRGARGVFEATLILGYMTLILGMRMPLPWRRPTDETQLDESPARVNQERERDRDHEPWRGL